MHTGVAAGVIQLVNHRQAKDQVRSLHTRMQMGVTKRQIGRKRIVFSPDTRESPFAGWWMMINRPADAKTVILKELAGIVLAHADPTGRIGDAVGGGVASAISAHSTASNLQTIGSMGDGSMADEVFDRWNGAWEAGVWSSAKGTKQEFAIAWRYFLTGGICTMSEPDGEGTVVGRTTMWDKDAMLRYMSNAEREGGKAGAMEYAIQRLNTRFGYTGTKDFKYSASAHKLSFI